VKLPTRQLAILTAGLLWFVGTQALAARPKIIVSEPIDAAGDQSMDVYPSELTERTGKSRFASLQPLGESLGETIIEPVTPEDIPPPASMLLDEQAPVMPGYGPAPLDASHEPGPLHVDGWGGDPPAAAWSSGKWFRSGVWYTAVDFFVARRDRPDDRSFLALDASTQRILFNYGPTGGVEPGIRATVGRFLGRDYLNRDYNSEFTFLGISEYDAEDGIRSIAADNLILLLIGAGEAGFDLADTYETDYASRFSSYEWDLRIRRRPDKDRVVMSPDGSWTRQYTRSYVPSMLVGLRYIKLDEDFAFESRRDGVARVEFGGDYATETHNDLLGVQVGGDWIDQHERWYWGVRGKAGGYVNFADQQTQRSGTGPVRVDDVVVTQSEFVVEEASKANAAFFGELSVMLAYHFTPNFAARASGDFMWLSGVALAPDQVTFNTSPPPRIDMAGDIMYMALSGGFEWVW
jgi:hypothetical protein